MGEIQELRIQTLVNIKAEQSVKKILGDNISCDVISIKNALSGKEDDEIDQLLFEMERYSYKKMAIFIIHDNISETLSNEVFKDCFMTDNAISHLNGKECINGLGDDIICTYFSEEDKYFTLKMACKKEIEVENEGIFGSVINSKKEYYDSVKFVVDKDEKLLFMFYNEAGVVSNTNANNNGKMVTQRKSAFYNLFKDGNKYYLKNSNINEDLNHYVVNFLNENLNEDSIEDIQKYITIIETEDPTEGRNNLRSSKKDCRHNIYRLKAIKYAIENEDHNVKILECKIGDQVILLKGVGEVIIEKPFFDKEVMENVCKEIFPKYNLISTKNESEIRDLQYT